MNRSPRRRWIGFALFAGMLSGILWVGMWHRAALSPGRAFRPDYNPNQFYLCSETGRFTYTFTYDPHAADAWLFEAGGFLDQSGNLSFFR